MKHYPKYSHSEIYNLKDLIFCCSKNLGEKTAFFYSKNRNELAQISYLKFKHDIDAFGTYLCALGLENSHIAVIGENSYEWVLTYFAVVNGSNVIIPIDKELSTTEIQIILTNSGTTVIVYSNDYVDIIEDIKSNNTNIQHFINMNDFAEITSKGNEMITSGNRKFIDQKIDNEKMAAIIYTSGTTGVSKGVMLSHKNLAADTLGTCQTVYLTGGNVLVLPLHHTFAFTAGILSLLLYGHPVYINKSLKRVLSDIKAAKPYHLDLVPLIVETMYKKIWIEAKKNKKDKLLKALIQVSNTLLKVGIDVRRKLFKTVLDSFGGNLELIISGGAPLANKYITGFEELGIKVINGYGISECSPVVAVNRNDYSKIGSVGVAIPHNKIKIKDGEILVKGQNVMLGYYKNPEATAEAFDGEWFKTGDLGYIDEDGFLYITGRKKNLIILDNGKNVYPEEIEGYLAAIEQIKEAVVYEENKLIAAEIYPDMEAENAEKIIREKIALLNKTLPIYKQVQSIKFRQTEFEKTTTKKIKRHKVGVNTNV